MVADDRANRPSPLSMRKTLRVAALLAAALGTLPGAAHAQQRANAAAARAAAADVQAWFAELEQLHDRLAAIQARALADPQVGAAQVALGNSIKAAITRVDPAVTRGLARMEALDSLALRAEERGDEARLRQLSTEAQQLQRAFVAAQERVLAQPEIAAQVEAFQQRLQRKMLEVEPGAEQIMTRFRELEARLAAEASASR